MSSEPKRSYEEACHAMQSGVAAKMHRDPKETEPKHLRVGINSNAVSHAALARILIEKGLFTVEEYSAAILAEMEREVLNYELHLDPTGRVKLH